MQADSEDRYINEPKSGGLPKLPIALAILAVVIGIAWYFTGNREADEEAPPPIAVKPAETPSPAVELPPAPDIPEAVAEPETAVAEEPNEAPPPPLTLADSDPVVRELVTPALDAPEFSQALNQEHLLERATALIDATSGGGLQLKVLPLPPIQGKFAITETEAGAVADPESYQRYDGYARAVDAVDTKQLAAAFHRFRPLLEEAYASLGYDADELDNALVRALDQIIAAPVLDNPAVLEKDVTTYKYADPALEQLSPLAKQLMRMGPENQRLIQTKARALRAELLGG